MDPVVIYARCFFFCVLGVILHGVFTQDWFPVIPVGVALMVLAALTQGYRTQ